MPPAREVDGRIEDLETELQMLRLVKQLQAGLPHPPAAVNGHAHPDATPTLDLTGTRPEAEQTQPVVDPMRLSRERRQIIHAMVGFPGGEASPAMVVAALAKRGIDKDNAPVQTNMQRMARYGMLERASHGRYRVLPHIARTVEELHIDDDQDQVMT